MSTNFKNVSANQKIITNTVISSPNQNIMTNKDMLSPDILIEPSSETMDLNNPSSSMEDFKVFDSNTIATNYNDLQSHASEPGFRVQDVLDDNTINNGVVDEHDKEMHANNIEVDGKDDDESTHVEEETKNITQTAEYYLADDYDEDDDTLETRRSIRFAENKMRKRWFINAKEMRDFEGKV